MKNKLFFWEIFCSVVFVIFLFGSSFADSLYVCVDPGHGGSDNGTHGRVYGSLEKEANLKVGLALKDSLRNDPEYWVVPIMTREGDEFLYPYQRANKAMYGGPDSTSVDQFLSIHHNAPDTTPPNPPRPDSSKNYTVTFYCDRPYVYPGDTIQRDVSDELASRVNAKVKELLQQAVPDIPWGSHGAEITCFDVLRRTSMISALCEVSFMTNHKIDSLYKYDATNYSQKEANGVYRGWHQYIDDDPIIVILNHFGGGYVLVDNINRESPFHGCWLPGETHTIRAFDQWSGDNYYYCKWSDGLAQQHDLWVGFMDEVHTAYFSYDGYYMHVDYPNGGQSYEVGKNMRIYWSADPGVYDPPYCWWTLADIYLSGNGGSTFNDTIVTNYPMMGFSSDYYDWTISGLSSNQCRIKIVAHDDACNSEYDISNSDFTLTYRATVEYPRAGDEWEIGRQYSIKWTASPGHNNSTLIDIKLSRNGGTSWETIANDLPNTGSYSWAVGGNLSTNCLIKVRAHDSAGNSAEAISGTFAITYKVTLISPERFMCIGWDWIIRCEVSPGQSTTTVIDFYLSRDSGATWPEYLGSRPYSHTPWGDDTLTWWVTTPHTQQAKVKLYAHDNSGHTAEYVTPYEFTICGGCIRGDIPPRGSEVPDGIFYTVGDAVGFAWWWVDSSSACDPDPIYGISPCDVNCDGRVSLGDLVYLVRIICDDFTPCDAGPPYSSGSPPYAGDIEVKAKENTISVSSDYPLGAMAFDFNTDGAAANPVLIAPNMQIKTSAQNGKLRVLVWNENGENLPPGTQDLFTISGNAKLISVGAAGNDGKELKANITGEITPSRYALSQNYPNPFNPQTQLEFSLAEASQVRLVIYNLLGQKVITLLDKTLPPGKHAIDWNGEDESGNKVASGIYFYRLQAGEYNEVRKMVMLK